MAVSYTCTPANPRSVSNPIPPLDTLEFPTGSEALLDVKHRVRKRYRFYSQDLINNLFAHPYTKIQFVGKDLGISRLTATRYLDELTAGGILRKVKVGRSNFYINIALFAILSGEPPHSPAVAPA